VNWSKLNVKDFSFNCNLWYGSIQIIRDTFWSILDTLPICHLVTPPLPQATWHFSFSKTQAFSRLQTAQNRKFKEGPKKCRVTLWLTPILPHVLFGDTFATPPPRPLECHILSEWSLIVWSRLTIQVLFTFLMFNVTSCKLREAIFYDL